MGIEVKRILRVNALESLDGGFKSLDYLRKILASQKWGCQLEAPLSLSRVYREWAQASCFLFRGIVVAKVGPFWKAKSMPHIIPKDFTLYHNFGFNPNCLCSLDPKLSLFSLVFHDLFGLKFLVNPAVISDFFY